MARKVVGVGQRRHARVDPAAGGGRRGRLPRSCRPRRRRRRCSSSSSGASEYTQSGQRVVEGQRLMQAASDTMLGWQRNEGIDGVDRDFYVRQLRDWKGSAVIEAMVPAGMRDYGGLCAWTLARAHARSGDRVAIAAYLGGSKAADEAFADFASGLRRPHREGPRGAGRRDRRRDGLEAVHGRLTARARSADGRRAPRRPPPRAPGPSSCSPTSRRPVRPTRRRAGWRTGGRRRPRRRRAPGCRRAAPRRRP